ncbi:hypothetical protein C9J12_29575 [Photobacterium frigidiphilum]|uniref:RanBP2-type domain-containing protein n=1 Tax=Photobacterium frigidiphilum TaxID=264736 RepID=A0A2T3J5R3_9GAMM|nr:hypothetical protein C9J12_29575 [Photobacterium frigidiphilum]
MVGYNWTCLVCDRGVDKTLSKCDRCGYPAGASSYEIDARKILLNHCNTIEGLNCNFCKNSKLNVKFHKNLDEYLYRQEMIRKYRTVLFEVLSVIIYCDKCDYKIEVEYKVPILRKLFRWILRKDIQSQWLKSI